MLIIVDVEVVHKVFRNYFEYDTVNVPTSLGEELGTPNSNGLC